MLDKAFAENNIVSDSLTVGCGKVNCPKGKRRCAEVGAPYDLALHDDYSG